jgi:hypothetical protein
MMASFDHGAVWNLARLEARIRLRRPATLMVLLAVVALSWLMICDPADGHTLIGIGGARVRYTSSALALGTASQLTLLFGLAGFYLLRGRMAEDQRSGLGGVIGASPAGGALFVLARWCGGVLYMSALCAAALATVLLCHAVRGEGPVGLLVYLQTWVLVLGPMVLFTAACATLCDSWAPLMGKAGDLLYFLLWVAQMGIAAGTGGTGAPPGAIPVDFSGMTAIVAAMAPYVDTGSMMLGIADFDPKLALLTLPDDLWTAALVSMRFLSAVLALLPLLAALRLFHRYSSDQVKPAKSRRRRSPLALFDAWLRPLGRLAQPLFRLSARVPGGAGQALADVALTLAANPSAVAALLLAQVLAISLDAALLAPLVLGCVAFWGLLVSDLAVRDADAGCAGLGAAVPGGDGGRYGRQLAATFLLGLMFTAVAAARLAADAPLRAGAVLAGVFALSSLASLLGRASGSARTFFALFLVGLYTSVNINKIPLADVVGFHGTATALSVLAWLGVGMAALWGGQLWGNRLRGC